MPFHQKKLALSSGYWRYGGFYRLSRNLSDLHIPVCLIVSISLFPCPAARRPETALSIAAYTVRALSADTQYGLFADDRFFAVCLRKALMDRNRQYQGNLPPSGCTAYRCRKAFQPSIQQPLIIESCDGLSMQRQQDIRITLYSLFSAGM